MRGGAAREKAGPGGRGEGRERGLGLTNFQMGVWVWRTNQTVMVGVEVTRRESSEEARRPASTDPLLGAGPGCTCWFVKE